MPKPAKKGPSYLDVTEFICSGPFSPKISPCVCPIEAELSDVLGFNNQLSPPRDDGLEKLVLAFLP